MKKTYLFLGLGVLAFALYSKYKVFWDNLRLSVGKVKLRALPPYTSFDIVITINAINPTKTIITLNSVMGDLLIQGKTIAKISGGSVILNQGKKSFDVFATIGVDEIVNLTGLKFDKSNIGAFIKQLVEEPFTTNLTFDTSLGRFSSKDNWKISDYA